MRVPGMVYLGIVRSPYAHARITKVNVVARARARGRRRRVVGRRSRRRVAGLAAVRVDPDRGHECAGAQAGRDRQGALRRRRGRGDRGDEPRRGRGRGGARRGRVRRRCRPSSTPRRRSRTARRSCTRSSARTAATRGRSRPARSTGSSRRPTVTVERALPPEPADPERDRAARGVRHAGSRDGRVHALVDDAGPAHRAHHAERRHRHPGGEAARDRARRRRRLRLEAERLRRGGARARDRAAARPAGQVDRDAQRGLRLDDPRPRPDAGDRARGDLRREDHGRPREADRGDGRVPPARHAGHAAARRVALRRLLRRRGLQLRVHRRLHEHGADRRVPRRRTAGGDVRDRACGRRARAQAREGPGRDPAARTSSASSRRRSRRGSRSTPATSTRVSTSRSSSPATTTCGPSSATRRARGRHEAARHRPLDVRRDVRARAVGDPRCDPLLGRRLGGGDDPLPADRNRAGADRLDAARAGPRDDVVADRRRPARLRHRRGRGAARRHGRRPARDGHVRQPQPRRRRRRALLRGGARSSRRRRRSPRT